MYVLNNSELLKSFMKKERVPLWSVQTLSRMSQETLVFRKCFAIARTYLQPHYGNGFFWQCLPFSWTRLRGKYCRHPIAVTGVVDMFEHNLPIIHACQRNQFVIYIQCCLMFYFI